MKVIKPPTAIPYLGGQSSVFLAGSIEMGKAVDWQAKATQLLLHLGKIQVVLNPRRDDWNSSWTQDITNPDFYQQVNWELQALEAASFIIMNLEPNTTSPISLLEFGLHAKSKKMIVVCPGGFARKGNVDIVCERYDIPHVLTLERAIDFINYKL